MRLRVADITIRVTAADPGMPFRVDGASEAFLAQDGEPDVEIVTSWGDNSGWSGREKLFDSGALWQLYRDRGQYLFCFTTEFAGPVPYKLAWFNRDFATGEIRFHKPYFAGHASIHPLEYPLDELLVTHYLSETGGVEVHACGLVDPAGRGCLFAGQSGAGKTTLARLWLKDSRVRILSDDRVVLREEGGRTWMHGTPWHGEGGMASPEKVQLERIFLLRQGSGNTLIPQKKATAAARLLSCSFPPFHSRRALGSVLGFIEQVVMSVPSDELIFTPDERAIQCLYDRGTS